MGSHSRCRFSLLACIILLATVATSSCQARTLHEEDDIAVPAYIPFAVHTSSGDALAEDVPSAPVETVIDCSSEKQVVMCGDIPFEAVQARRDCCAANREVEPTPEIAAMIAAADDAQLVTAAAAPLNRPDLDSAGAVGRPPAYIYNATCLRSTIAQVPSFTGTMNGQLFNWTVPVLNATIISRIKSAAMATLQASNATAWMVNAHNALRKVNATSGFIHPGTAAGPQELAFLHYKLATANPAITIARDSLLTGSGVPPKNYGSWAPPTNTPLSNYTGPYDMPTTAIRWAGLDAAGTVCPANYPAAAPRTQCAHLAFVELDAVQAYRQAMAWWATNNTGYANNAQRIIDGWAMDNTKWGVLAENGPLEAGWGCAAMAKALEYLKNKRWSGYDPAVEARFMKWFNTVMFPQLDWLVNNTISRTRGGEPNVYSNWQSTTADCLMAVSILSDNRVLYNRAKDHFVNTTNDYLRWGRGAFAVNRTWGEATETLRDIYHTEFALAGLLYVAEMAWQQNEDLYSTNNYALAASLELHARIINAALAGNNETMLPPGFKFYDKSMPTPAAACPASCTATSCSWKFDSRTQLWSAYNSSNVIVCTLSNNIKYIVGPWALPSNWEMGFNHYVGRLGMWLPETASLIAKKWPDYYEFHWGLTTLTHADTASMLWRTGVRASSICV